MGQFVMSVCLLFVVAVFGGGHLQTFLHDFGEVVGVGVAATVSDGHEGEIGGLDEVHRLEEAPFTDHPCQRLACQELYRVAEIAGVDVETVGDVLGFEEGGCPKDFYHRVKDRFACGLVS